MKYKDPITGELRDVIIKSGDTLPIGTVVEFDGETIPDGYEEFETEDYGSLGNIIVDDVICKNLCSGISQGYFININGTSFGRTLADNGLVIKVEENNDYTISTTDTQARYRIAFTNTLLSIGGSSSDIYNALTKDGTKASITRNSGAYKYLIVNATDLSKIQVEKGSVATDYVAHKEFTNNSPSIITANLAEETSLSTTSSTKVPLVATVNVGDKLSITDGGIVIGTGVKNIKVSATARFDTTAEGNILTLYIKNNGINYMYANAIAKGNRESLSLTPRVINVNDGDVITLEAQNGSSTESRLAYANRLATYVTVEVIN